jgi:hypothetical protein
MPYNPPVDFDLQLRTAVYRYFASRAEAPPVAELCRVMRTPSREIRAALHRLHANRLLVLMPDGDAIRMALPFSAVPTQHRVRANAKEFFANCAWDSFGIAAALHAEAEVISRCEQSGEPLHVRVGRDPDLPAGWCFHAAVPAVHWWRDIVYT